MSTKSPLDFIDNHIVGTSVLSLIIALICTFVASFFDLVDPMFMLGLILAGLHIYQVIFSRKIAEDLLRRINGPS